MQLQFIANAATSKCQFVSDTDGMGDLKDSNWMYLKAVLFLLIGVISGGLILVEARSYQTAILLGLAVWAFCRLYYFMFYVIEKYVDGQYRFSGIGSFVRYLMTVRRSK